MINYGWMLFFVFIMSLTRRGFGINPSFDSCCATTDEDISFSEYFDADDDDDNKITGILFSKFLPGWMVQVGDYSFFVDEANFAFNSLDLCDRLPGVMLHITPPLNCDIDFTFRAEALNQVGSNCLDETNDEDNLKLQVFAIADAPLVIWNDIPSVVEDYDIMLDVSGTLLDTDGSEKIHEFAFINLPFINMRFVSIPSSSSSIVGMDYTVTCEGYHKGFGIDCVHGFSLQPVTDCDIDFSLTCRAESVERNGGDTETSTTMSVGIVVSAQADGYSIDAAAVASMAEDSLVALFVTPLLLPAADSDGSESLDEFRVLSMPPGSSFLGISSSFSSILASSYSLSKLGGFSLNNLVPQLSLVSTAQSDIDFTISALFSSVERNGFDDQGGISESIGVVISAVADIPGIIVSTQSVPEDTATCLQISPFLA
eukprot:Rmarinus@m.4873